MAPKKAKAKKASKKAPPEELFDAQLDVGATFAANICGFQVFHNQSLALRVGQWSSFYKPLIKSSAEPTLTFQQIATFLETEPTGSLALSDDSARASRSEKERARLKGLNELFGQVTANRGHGIAQTQDDDPSTPSKTIPLEAATLYVLGEWVDRQGVLPTAKKGWKAQKQEWAAEGKSKAEMLRLEKELTHEMLQSLPVFAMKNGGVYYSSKMLAWALGFENHPYQLFRVLRDANRRPLPRHQMSRERPDWRLDELGNRIHGEEITKRTPVGDPGASSSSGVIVHRGSGLHPQEVVFRSTCAAEFLVDVFSLNALAGDMGSVARAVIGAAQLFNLIPEEAAVRAELQIMAAGGDARAFRLETVRAFAHTLQQPPDVPEKAFKDVQKRQEEGKARNEAQKREAAGGAAEEGSESDDSGDEEIDLERAQCESGDEWAGDVADRPDFNPQEAVPTKELGEVSRFHEDFDAGRQMVCMQSNYDEKLESLYKGRYNLWKAGRISKILPSSIPLQTSHCEAFFSESLVRAALPGLETVRNHSLSLAALAVTEGAPVDLLGVQAASTPHMFRMARAAAVKKAQVGGEQRWADPTPEDGQEAWDASSLAARQLVLSESLLSGEEARKELELEGVREKMAKRRRIVPEQL